MRFPYRNRFLALDTVPVVGSFLMGLSLWLMMVAASWLICLLLLFLYRIFDVWRLRMGECFVVILICMFIKRLCRMSTDFVFLLSMNLVKEIVLGTISWSVRIFISLIFFICYVLGVCTAGCLCYFFQYCKCFVCDFGWSWEYYCVYYYYHCWYWVYYDSYFGRWFIFSMGKIFFFCCIGINSMSIFVLMTDILFYYVRVWVYTFIPCGTWYLAFFLIVVACCLIGTAGIW